MEFSLDNALIAAAILLVGLAVMVVNLLTIVVVLRTPQLRHSDQPQANLYVVNLAVADTLAGISLVWVACLFIPETKAFIDRNYALCTSAEIVSSAGATVCNSTMLAIALDRMCYIVYPFFYRRFVSERFTKATILTIWCWSALYGCIFPLLNKSSEGECRPNALLARTDFKIMLNTLLLLQFVVATACYLRIAVVVRSQQRRIRAILHTASNHSPQDGYTTDKDNVETPKPRVFATTNHRPEAREDPVSCVKCQLQLKPVAFFPNGGGNGDTSLQVKSELQDVSGKTLQPDFASPSADHLEVESTKVNILLATEKIEKLTGLASASHVKDPIQARTGSKPFKPPEAQSIPQKDINVKKTTNVAMFVVINLFFTLSWLPLVVYLMFFDTAQEYNDIILDLLIMPTYANSLLNFAVYTWKNTEYRNAYKRLFKNNICCRST